MKLRKNQTISMEDGEFTILDALGEGGQGEVYLADYKGKKYAFKLYKDRPSEDFCYNLRNNIAKGSPSESFLWPKKYVALSGGDIGYLMDLRPEAYKSFVAYLNGNVDFKNTATMLGWCIELCQSFKRLHENGFSYQDLNDGSFFLNEESGELLICDNDNVAADKKNMGILGKMRYMAPEIVRGEYVPDVHSDRFSLAVILFLALCKGNPYEGERLKNYDIIDEKVETQLFGTNPVFVYDRADRSNRPIRGYHTALIRRWPVIPLYIKEAFHRTFVEGLTDRENGRTTELEWIKLLTMYRDELVTCSCGKQYKYGLAENRQVAACPFCNAAKPERLILALNRHNIVLEPDKHLYETHFDKYSSNYNKSVATVITGRKNAAVWGIKLECGRSAKLTDAKGNEKDISVNGVVPILRNLKIEFSDRVHGEIK